jgi:hypothetical protein
MFDAIFGRVVFTAAFGIVSVLFGGLFIVFVMDSMFQVSGTFSENAVAALNGGPGVGPVI